MRDGDTIVALSSGALPSGVAVVRFSGPRSAALLEFFTGRVPQPRILSLANVAAGGVAIDRGLAVWFPGPTSFTGEDCAELQVHGSPAGVRAILRAATENGARLAEAGEFTRRAFENGKLDLTEVEGLGDLIEAETENQHRQALSRMSGGLSVRIAGWRSALLDMRAEIEARLDFSDEGDVDEDVPEAVADAIDALRLQLSAALSDFGRGRLLRDGLRIALGGAPNAGKSSLLNALARTDIAIVSEEAGTTRDVREVPLNLGGQLCVLVDMAGLRESDSLAEREGVRRAHHELQRADLVLWLVAPDTVAVPVPNFDAPRWIVGTKADLVQSVASVDLQVSAVTGRGLPQLLASLASFASECVGQGEPSLLSQERDRVAIAAAAVALGEAAANLGELEVAAELLRQASQALARLTGELGSEAVLDRLFLSFCIGK